MFCRFELHLIMTVEINKSADIADLHNANQLAIFYLRGVCVCVCVCVCECLGAHACLAQRHSDLLGLY